MTNRVYIFLCEKYTKNEEIKFFVISLFFYCKRQSEQFKNKDNERKGRKEIRIPEREAGTEGRSGNLREQRASSPRLPSFASLISNL